MGQKIEDIKGGKKNEGGEKKSDASIFLKSDLHRADLAKELGRFIRDTPGVEKVNYCETRKLTIKRDVYPTRPRQTVAIETKKKVEIILSPPKKEATRDKKSGVDGAGDKKPRDKTKKKTEDKKADKKKPKDNEGGKKKGKEGDNDKKEKQRGSGGGGGSRY